MKAVKVTEFRARLPRYLSRVAAGETISLLSRGRTVAHLVPAPAPAAEAKRQLAALRKHARIGDVISPLDVEWKAGRGHP